MHISELFATSSLAHQTGNPHQPGNPLQLHINLEIHRYVLIQIILGQVLIPPECLPVLPTTGGLWFLLLSQSAMCTVHHLPHCHGCWLALWFFYLTVHLGGRNWNRLLNCQVSRTQRNCPGIRQILNINVGLHTLIHWLQKAQTWLSN